MWKHFHIHNDVVKNYDSLFYHVFCTGNSDSLYLFSLFQVLEADNNSIVDLEGVYQLPKLEEISLKNNSILKCV